MGYVNSLEGIYLSPFTSLSFHYFPPRNGGGNFQVHFRLSGAPVLHRPDAALDVTFDVSEQQLPGCKMVAVMVPSGPQTCSFFVFFWGGLGEEKLNLNPKDVFDFRKVGKNKFKPT